MADLKHIKEYIDTGDGVAGTLLIPKLIFPTLIKEVDKNLLPRELAAFVITPAQWQGDTFNFNLEEENSMNLRIVGEGAEIPMDELGYESREFEAVKYGVAIRITREMIEDSQFPILQGQLRIVGKRFAEKETELIIAALTAGVGSTITGGAAFTIGNLTEAMLNIENEDYTPTDMICGNEVIHDLRNIDTFAEADKWGDITSYNRTGWIGVLYGLKVYRYSTNAAPSTTYAKYCYVIDRDYAFAIAIKRDLTIENFDLPTYDMQGAVATMRLDVDYLRTDAISKITTE